jgi:hypothetical protein
MPTGFLASRHVRAGLGLGAALAAGIAFLVWNQGLVADYATASLLDFEPRKTRVPESDLLSLETPPGVSQFAAPEESSAIVPSRYEAFFWREYFEPWYYAPASPGRASAPVAAFTAPWPGDFGDLHKIGAVVAPTPAIDFSHADKLALPIAGSVLAPPAPAWRLANTGPFHVFVTTDAVSPTASIGSAAPSAAFSAVPGSGLPGVASVGETAGSLLRRR